MLTRNKAISVIAGTTDKTVISSFTEHQNKHVRHYAKHKLDLLNVLGAVDVVTTQKDLKQFLSDSRSSVRSFAESKMGTLRSEASRKAALTRKSKQTALVA